MQGAEQRLQSRDPKGALPGEQQALASLQRAEEAYRDVRVRMDQQRGGGGGGGGGQQSSGAAEELANLFQLEMDKLRNQYETFDRSQQQSADATVDAMLERLKELARRQEQEAERQRQMAGNRQSGGSAASARQRQLAAETEEAARQLERLSREDNRQDLGQMARDLRAAADAMRRAAASGDAAAFGEARAAADRLSRARDSLERQRTDRMARDIDSALSRTRRLANEQKAIESDVRALDKAGANRPAQVQQLQGRKDAEAGEVADLEKQLDRTAADFRRERPDAARKVQQAADAIRDNKLKEKIQYSRGLVQGAPTETAAGFEEQIGADIAALETRLRGAADAVNAAPQNSRADALARARGLARGVGSMEQRLREEQQRAAEQRGGGARGAARPDQPGGDARAGGGNIAAFDPRQLQREARERRTDAQALRRDLQALGIDVKDLDAVISTLAALDSARVYTDADEITRLRDQLAQTIERFQFNLRRELGAADVEQLLLSGSDAAPEAYRKQIEEYYRALAREKKK
jgi:hypothetical protein